MSYPRRTRTKSHTHPQRSPGPESTFTATAISHPRIGTPFPTVPHPCTTSHTHRKRTHPPSGYSTQTRKRASSATAASLPSRPFLFTPSTPPIVGPRNSPTALGPPPPYTPFPLTAKSPSSSHLSQNISTATFLAQYTPPRMRLARAGSSDSESEPDPLDEDDDGMIYTAKQLGHGTAFRSRILPRHSKGITTAPGELGAGETETEADEPVRTHLRPPVPDRKFNPFRAQPRHLPTARIVPVSGPLVPPNSLEQVITPLLFEASRLLSIVPAVFGVLYNLFNVWHAPKNGKIVPIDYVVSALWVRHFDNIYSSL